MKTIRWAAGLALALMVAATAAFAVEPPQKCEQCGMDRDRFSHSRTVVQYPDGSSAGLCSIHCAAADLRKKGVKKGWTVKVADYGTKELVDARSAAWVAGGKVRGVMTGVPKWAFASKADAKAFIAENGGKLSTFDKALRASTKEVEELEGAR
jgi:hypothetical protein